MKIFWFLILVIAVVGNSSGLQAQNNTGQQTSGVSEGTPGFWEIDTPGGKFFSRIDHISSVSQHEYVIDGTVKVYECTISVTGGLIGRFYYIEPVGAGNSTISSSNTFNRAKDIANRVTNKGGMGDAEHIVTKHYPDTTHAKTSEYRFKYKDTIGRIYQHAHNAIVRDRGRGKENKITIRE